VAFSCGLTGTGRVSATEERLTASDLSIDGLFTYDLEQRIENGDSYVDVALTNISEESLEQCSYRLHSVREMIGVEGAYIYARTPDGEVVIGQEAWKDAWHPGETRSFTLHYENCEDTDLLSGIDSFLAETNYGGVEDDEGVILADSDINLTTADFDVSDGIETLSENMQELYQKVAAEEATVDSNGDMSLRIRKNAKEVAATKEYTIQLTGLPGEMLKDDGGTYVIQNFYVGSTYIYVTQRRKLNGSNVVFLSRCKISGKTATYVSNMEVSVGGHGQTLELYDYNGKTYLLIDVCTKDTTDGIFGKQIARVKYQSGTVGYDDMVRLTYLAYSADGVTDFKPTVRADAALSTDKKYMLIWKRNGSGNTQCTIHDFTAINKAMDKVQNNKDKVVSFYHNSSIKSVASFANKSYMGSRSQGVELSNKGSNGLFSIYWSLGDENEVSTYGAAQFIGIKRYNSKGEFKTDCHVTHTDIKELKSVQVEMEGLSIPQSGSNIRFLLVPCSGSKKTQYICTIPKEKLVSDES